MAVGHLVPRQGQNGHRPDRQGQVEQVDGHAEARQQQRDAGGGDAPGTGEEQRQGVMQGAEDERRDGQDEPEQRGRQPRVQEEGGREEGRGLQGDRDKSGGDGLLVSTNFRIGFLASLEKKGKMAVNLRAGNLWMKSPNYLNQTTSQGFPRNPSSDI